MYLPLCEKWQLRDKTDLAYFCVSTLNLLIFISFLHQKRAKSRFYQQLNCKATKRWSKYTTDPVFFLSLSNKQHKNYVRSFVHPIDSAGANFFSSKKFFLAKGHLSPDADFVYQEWQDATYYFFNVVPQVCQLSNLILSLTVEIHQPLLNVCSITESLESIVYSWHLVIEHVR